MIATADHGEMGTAHGGLRQKNFNFYEESIRVPLVYSNPRLFKKAETNHALVSHVDFLPTLASLVGAPADARSAWQGVDYSDQILSRSPKPAQDYTVFTYDDWQSGQARGPYPQPPNHVVSIREQRYKLARYYDADGKVPDQWEMYDLKSRSAGARQPCLQAPQAHSHTGARIQAAAAQARPRRTDAAAAVELRAVLRVRSAKIGGCGQQTSSVSTASMTRPIPMATTRVSRT